MRVLDLIEAKGIRFVFRGEEIGVVCPNAANHQGGDDAIPSFNINEQKMVAHCFACDFVLTGEKLLKWLTGEDVDDLILKALAVRAKLRKLKKSEEEELFEAPQEIFFPPGKPWDEDGFRGIRLETYHRLGAVRVVRGRYQNRIAFPVYVNGVLKGVDARALDPDMVPKYLRNKNSSCKVDWLFPYDLVKEAQPELLLLGEGLFHGINSIDKGYFGLCYFGSNNWSQTKLRMILATGAKRVCYFRDRDVAGEKAEQVIGSDISQWLPFFSASWDGIPAGLDLGDLSAEQIDSAVNKMVKPKLPACLPLNEKGTRQFNMPGKVPVYDEECKVRKCPFWKDWKCNNLVWIKKGNTTCDDQSEDCPLP